MGDVGETSDLRTTPTSAAHRTAHVVGAVVIVAVVPALVLWLLIGEFAAAAMFTGLLLGVVGAKLGDTGRMAFSAPGVGMAAGLGAYAAYGWWWAALLALTGLIAGVGIGFGWFGPLLM